MGSAVIPQKTVVKVDKSFVSDAYSLYSNLSVPDLPDWKVDAQGRQIAFVGNRKVKPAGVLLPYTEDHVAEILRCKNDIFYFAKYFHVVHKDRGRERINLYPYQYSMIEHIVNNRFSLLLCPRQSGKTTVASIVILWLAMFNPDMQIGILSYKASGAKDFMARIRTAYYELPNWLRQGVIEFNKFSIEFENGSVIFAEATTEDSLTGKSLNMVVFDEVAKVRPSLFNHLYNSIYPTIASGKNTRICMFSTPKGLNHWWTLCDEAKKGVNGYAFMEVKWDAVPGRDEKFKEETIARIGRGPWLQEFECEFLGSSQTLISSDFIRKMRRLNPISVECGERARIYEEFSPDKTYIAGIDTSSGTGKDYHAVQVLDITKFPVKQVAVFHANDLNTSNFAHEANAFLRKYGKPMLMIENNEYGGLVADALFNDYEYENIYWQTDEYPGLRTSSKTKKQMLALLKDFIENDKIEIVDADTIYEFTTFVRRKNSFEAENGYNDDLVMSLAIALFVFKTEMVDADRLTQRIVLDQDVLDDAVEPVMPDTYKRVDREDIVWLLR